MYEEIKFGINLSFSVGLYFMSSKNTDLRQVVVRNYHEMLKKYYLLESSFHILVYVIITEYIHKNISSN